MPPEPPPADLPPDRGAPRRGATVEFIVRDTEDAIRSGRLALGQRLVEADLMRQLGVSRGPLREALNRLSAAGWVEIVPNRGAAVRRLTRKEVADRFAIRERLEGMAAALTAGRLGEGRDRARFLAATQAGTTHRQPVETQREQNFEFHGLIAELSGNPQLADMIRRLWLPAVMVEMRRSLDAGFWRRSIEDHERIAGAILAAKPDTAESVMREHLRRQCEAILSLPARVFGEP